VEGCGITCGVYAGAVEGCGITGGVYVGAVDGCGITCGVYVGAVEGCGDTEGVLLGAVEGCGNTGATLVGAVLVDAEFLGAVAPDCVPLVAGGAGTARACRECARFGVWLSVAVTAGRRGRVSCANAAVVVMTRLSVASNPAAIKADQRRVRRVLHVTMANSSDLAPPQTLRLADLAPPQTLRLADFAPRKPRNSQTSRFRRFRGSQVSWFRRPAVPQTPLEEHTIDTPVPRPFGAS
jgi:hypothetical protein